MVRLLCLGYSVTELPGYVEAANTLAAQDANPLTFVRSGWGGHSINAVAYLIDEVLDAAECGFVLLEVFSGSIRYLETRAIARFLDEILIALARRNLPVAFLNLYQGGVDYDNDRVTRLAHRYAADHRIPILDLASLVFALSPDNRTRILRDNVHVTPLGGELYGEWVYAFLRHPPVRRDYVRDFRDRPRLYRALPVPALAPDRPTSVLTRNGTPLTFTEIPEGTGLVLDLGRPAFVEAVMLVYGPLSGTLSVRDAATGRTRTLTPYDSFCYYTRSGAIDLKLPAVRRLAIDQRAGMPATALRKGEADRGPRLGRVSHVFCRRPLSLAEHLRLHAARLATFARRLVRRWRRRRSGVWRGASEIGD